MARPPASSRPDLVSMLLGAILLVAIFFAPLMAIQQAESGASQIAMQDTHAKPTTFTGPAGSRLA